MDAQAFACGSVGARHCGQCLQWHSATWTWPFASVIAVTRRRVATGASVHLHPISLCRAGLDVCLSVQGQIRWESQSAMPRICGLALVAPSLAPSQHAGLAPRTVLGLNNGQMVSPALRGGPAHVWQDTRSLHLDVLAVHRVAVVSDQPFRLYDRGCPWKAESASAPDVQTG